MSVTKIIFKQGAPTIPFTQESIDALQGSVGEPLWHTTRKELYVSDGANAPVLIGPYTHPAGAIIVPANTNITGSTAVAGVTDGYLTGTADQGYAISGLTIDANGHVVGLSAVALPSAGTTVSYSAIGQVDTTNHVYEIGTLTISGDSNSPYTLSIPEVSGTNDGTNWTSIRIGSDTYAIPAGGGSSTGRDDELTASEHNDQTADGSIDMYTAANPTSANKPKVTLRHKAQTNGAGTYAELSISQSSTSINKIVEVEITEINGGTWS